MLQIKLLSKHADNSEEITETYKCDAAFRSHFLVRLVLALIVVVSAAHSMQRVSDKDNIISEGAIGDVKVRMTVDDFQERHPNASLVDLQLEGSFSPAFDVKAEESKGKNRTLLTAEIGWNEQNQWVITRIHTCVAAYKTSKGIHVGSAVSEVLIAYPSAKRLAGEGSAWLFDATQGLSFELTQKQKGENATVSCILVTAPDRRK